MSDPFVGEIVMFAGNFAPLGWASCDGQLLSISQNNALFSLFGTTYGGDGRTTFGLPDLRGRIPIHMGNGLRLSAHTLGATGGSEQELVTQNQLPSHTHPAQGTTDNGLDLNPSGNVLATSTVLTPYAAESPTASMAATAIVNTGGGQPHTNLQPFLCVNFIVALSGIFPSRN